MRPELRECTAPGHIIPERRHFRHVPALGDENALACRRTQHGRVEGHLTEPIDGRDNRLRSDIKAVEASPARRGQTRPHGGAQCAKFGDRNSRWLR